MEEKLLYIWNTYPGVYKKLESLGTPEALVFQVYNKLMQKFNNDSRVPKVVLKRGGEKVFTFEENFKAFYNHKVEDSEELVGKIVLRLNADTAIPITCDYRVVRVMKAMLNMSVGYNEDLASDFRKTIMAICQDSVQKFQQGNVQYTTLDLLNLLRMTETCFTQRLYHLLAEMFEMESTVEIIEEPKPKRERETDVQ